MIDINILNKVSTATSEVTYLTGTVFSNLIQRMTLIILN